MARGNAHKMVGGYKRNREKIPTTVMLLQAKEEETEEIHALCLEEMELDEFDHYQYDPNFFSDDDFELEEPLYGCDPMDQYYDSLASFF